MCALTEKRISLKNEVKEREKRFVRGHQTK